MRAPDDGFHHAVDLVIVDDDLDRQLVGDVQLVGLAPPFADLLGRLAVAAHVADREPVIAGLLEADRHLAQALGAKDRLDLLHPHRAHHDPTSSRMLAPVGGERSVMSRESSTG